MLLARTETGLAGAWFEKQKHHPDAIDAPERDDDPLLTATARQLRAYFDGEIDALRRAARPAGHGVPARRLAGAAAHRAPARRAATARSRASSACRRRAAPSASAVGRNPVSIIVPCHRVVGSSGALTGYAGGLERKTSLLRIEAERARSRRGARQLELH